MFQQAKGIATINGQISGGLLTFDFEGKSHGVACVFDRWLLQIRSQSEVLANKLICHTTAGGGHHARWRYSISSVASQKLAQASDGKLLIELKGERGYTICPPTPGYSWVYQGWPSLSVISTDELDCLIKTSLQFDQSGLNAKRTKSPDNLVVASYNQSDEWRSVLERKGWKSAGLDNDQIEHWTRPGKNIDDGSSATWSIKENRGECPARRLYVFSSNAAPLEAERSYTPFQLYQHLECQGEAQQAAKALSAADWGTSDNPAPEVPPLEVLNLPTLMSEEYRPLKWAVEPILPAGLTRQDVVRPIDGRRQGYGL